MYRSTTKVILQPLVVTSGATSYFLDGQDLVLGGTGRVSSSASYPNALQSATATYLFDQSTFLSVPILTEQQLLGQYVELGEAIGQLTELVESDLDNIDEAVFASAYTVAATLRDLSIPAPKVFSHGPKSIVFNWVLDRDNFYLTVSSDYVSALLTSPERIKKRAGVPLVALLSSSRTLGNVTPRLRASPSSSRPTWPEFGYLSSI